MNQKPPNTRTRRSGWLGHRATRLKSLAVVGAITLGFAGAALVAAGPASADPSFQFVQVGSDTTQYLMDAYANALGGSIIGEYDAVNPVTQTANEAITPEIASATVAGAGSNCSFTRPNGSGGGYKAMSFAFTVTPANTGPTTTLGQNGTPPQAGCISIVRSSSPPGSVNTTAGNPGSSLTNGNFVYIPYAVDAVTYATGATAPVSQTTQCVAALNTSCTTNVGTNGNPAGIGNITFTPTATAIPQTLNLSVAQLTTLYGQCLPVTVGTTTLNPGTSFSFTMNSAVGSPAVFTTATSSSLAAGTQVTLEGGSLPPGFNAQSVYFVASTPAPTATTFALAATPTGTAINVTATTADPTGSGSGTVATLGNVDLYAPQPGSGTLAFWELTFNLTAPAACWHQVVVAGPAVGIAAEEHDGTALASDPNGIEPFSIGRWVSGSTGVTKDLRHGALLQSITSAGTTPVVVPPLNSGGTINVGGCLAGTSFNQATCFPLTRELYNVMDYYEVNNVTPAAGITNNVPFNALLAAQFVGASSGLCKATFTIENQGFSPLLSGFTDTCGSIANSLRTQMNNSATNG
jgi:hypothetical protein